MEENRETVNQQSGKVGLTSKAIALLEAAIVVGIGAAGFAASFTAKWGGGSRTMNAGVFPRLVFILMIISGVCMFFSKNKYDPPPKNRDVKLLFVLLTLVMIGIYFYAVLKIGLVVSTVVYLLGAYTALTKEPKKDIPAILCACAVSTVLIWLIFAKVAVVLFPTPLLF